MDENLLKIYLNRGTIEIGDVVGSSKEAIMKTIVSRVHRYTISAPKKGAKDQRWFTYIDDETKPKGRKRIAKNTEGELFEFLLQHYGIDKESVKKRITFGELFEEWCQYKEGFVKAVNKKKSLSPSTVRRYRRDYERCLKGTVLDSTPLSEVTSILIETTLRDAIKKHKLGESYAGNLFGYVSNAFSYALRQRYTPVNEFEFVDKARVLSFVKLKPPKTDADRVLTKKELQALLYATRKQQRAHPRYLPNYAIELATMTGMRVGELAALHWSDIRGGVIHIDYSEHRLDYEDHSDLVIDEPKSLKHRQFPLNSSVEDLLNRVKALGFHSEFVFGNDEKRFTGHDISCACDRRASEAGIKKTSIHGIRRTVASELRKSFDIKLVASLMGHLEETDEAYYNYDNSEFSEKKAAGEHLCSSVLTFQPNFQSKKKAKTS